VVHFHIIFNCFKVLHQWYSYFTLQLYVWITYLLDFIPILHTSATCQPSKSFSPKFQKLRGNCELYRLSFRGVFERKKLPNTTPTPTGIFCRDTRYHSLVLKPTYSYVAPHEIIVGCGVGKPHEMWRSAPLWAKP
jgi:hypothetical protein